MVNIAAWDRRRYLGSLMYDAAKATLVRATATLAHEAATARRPRRRRVPRLHPHRAGGHGRRARARVAASTPADASPRSPADPDVGRRSGGGYRVGELARDYGVTDVDGSQPEPFDLPDELALHASVDPRVDAAPLVKSGR